MRRAPHEVIGDLMCTGLRDGSVVRSDEDLWQRLQARPVQRIVTMNLYDLHHYVRDERLRALIDKATAWTADGFPLVRALRRAGLPLVRVTGSGLCEQLITRPAADGLVRVAILGSDDASVDLFAGRLGACGRELVHRETGDRDGWLGQAHIAELRRAAPALVLIAVGAPHGLPITAAVASALPEAPVLCVGAGVGMAAGTDRRAPRLVQACHGEWVWRLARDPTRLWRRYVLDAAPLLLPLRRAVALTRRRNPSGDRGPRHTDRC